MKVEVIAIRTQADYAAARALLASLMNARTAAEGARLRAQAALIAAYEADVAPLRAVDPRALRRRPSGRRRARR